MIEIFVAVFEFFLILSASYGISFFFLRKEPTDIIFENIVIRITLGFGVISFITLIAGGFRFLNISFFIIVILVGNVMFFKYIVFLKNVKINIKFSWLGLILFIFIIINLFFSLFPPTFHDSMVYHLAVPSYYIMHGGIVPWNTNFNSNLPLNVEMLYLFSLLGKTVFVPKLLSFFAGIAILLLMFSWCRAQFSKHFFMIPLLLFYTIPEIGFLTSSSKTEMIGMLFLFVAFRFFFLYVKKLSEIRFLILSGVFWGLAIGTKYTFAFFLMGFLVSLVFFKPLKFTKRLFTIFMILILVFLCMVPWFTKNILITGNPTYPYLSSIFKSEYWNKDQISDFSKGFRKGYSNNLLLLLWYPIDIFIKPYKYGMTSVLGTFFLVFLPFLFFSKRNSQIKLLIISAVTAFVFLFFFSRVSRYFLPTFLLLSIPVTTGVERILNKLHQMRKLILPVSIGILLFNLILQMDLQEKYFKGFDFISKKVSGKLSSDAKYLYALPYYAAVEYINRNLSPDDLIIFLGEDRSFYIQKKFIASSRGDQNILIELLRESRNYNDFIKGLNKSKITHILYNPKGLKEMSRRTFLYGLSKTEQDTLNFCFANLTRVYYDNSYFIYKVKKESFF